MLLLQGLREYRRSSPWPEQNSISIQLKQDLSLTLDIPDFGVVTLAGDAGCLSRVVLAHAAFKAALHPEQTPNDAFAKKCAAEVNVISLFFPDIQDDAVRIVFAAWLAFACVMDDILETLSIEDREAALLETIQLLRPAPVSPPSLDRPASTGKDKRIQGHARVLYAHGARYLSQKSASAFFKAVAEVLEAHADEIRFLHAHETDSLPTYMSIRCRTIALNPFFEVIKSEYLPDIDAELNNALLHLQREVSCVAGLQNDMVGLVRDLEDGEQLNAVMVLMRGFKVVDMTQPDPKILARCVAMVNAEHNQSVARSIEHTTLVHRAAAALCCSSIAKVEKVTRHILMMCETHLKWCASAKRYRLEASINGTSFEITEPTSRLANGNYHNDQPRSVPHAQLAKSELASSQLVVQSRGVFHGLPTYPDAPDYQNLTALVTGATGLSGYQMVKVLAASPQRWSKIYCLSSRPPPENFFADLGEGASRVEHLAVDFMGVPEEIARRLQERIQHVDHVFYFSYMQPPPKGDVLNLWANADELATVNITMFTNFLAALDQTPLRPRRFLLQTGTKHYAFYLGPAAIPAFESDQRVTLDRNFYYEQEDALAAYCASIHASWTVARPSYIVGAVRDGTLNHLIGFGIYAAVQAHLGEKIAFPGDYRAWDREQVQSTGMLNAWFEEWLVLTEGTENQAFNIHDGLGFTWGRLWPMLGRWYGVEWCPPETEECKYRLMEMRGETPRGYGPQAALRSTFTLLEWSLQPHVEEAWKTLAQEHNLVLDPFDDRYRARIFSFADSAVIGDAPMTTSVRKAREYGFFGTVDSYRSIFDTFHDLARLKLIPAPVMEEFTE
ncbi:hypothetical protein VTI74DRAFT_1067 [Chaetomium olivicolor]